MKCRACGANASLPFVDLVNAPPSNSYLAAAELNEPESYFPLKVFVCENCWLVQVDERQRSDEIFGSRYAYFSSFSTSWLRHSQDYVRTMTDGLALNEGSFVVEVASNDGYLLQYFNEAGIPCLGIEPTASTAAAARDKGVATVEAFFGAGFAPELVKEWGQADLMLGNNVLAHVPDINDFAEGFRRALKPGGTLTFEFPHLLNLIRFNQFDTIYHEHFSYLSLTVVRSILAAHELTVYDVEELPTHGGSLRVFVRHAAHAALPVSPAVDALEQREIGAGLRSAEGYRGFQQAADTIRADVMRFLYDCRAENSKVAAYGAAAKGNTLLNYCGIKGNDLVEYVVDRSPHKQGLFLPGSHLPIVPEERLRETRPDVILVLPWNLRAEITEQLAYAREWGARFAVCVPQLEAF